MGSDIMQQLTSDLQSIYMMPCQQRASIVPSEHFNNLIHAWLTGHKDLEKISVKDYILFKSDLQSMLQAEIELSQDKKRTGIWLISEETK